MVSTRTSHETIRTLRAYNCLHCLLPLVKKKIVYIVHSVFSNRYGSWAVCFTYGTWFGVKGLVAAGRTFKNSPAITKACDFLLSKELPSGGWGESYLSSQDQVNSFL